jgi:hypothetical protein
VFNCLCRSQQLGDPLVLHVPLLLPSAVLLSPGDCSSFHREPARNGSRKGVQKLETTNLWECTRHKPGALKPGSPGAPRVQIHVSEPSRTVRLPLTQQPPFSPLFTPPRLCASPLVSRIAFAPPNTPCWYCCIVVPRSLHDFTQLTLKGYIKTIPQCLLSRATALQHATRSSHSTQQTRHQHGV